MLLHGLRCYTLYFLFAIFATVHLTGEDNIVDLDSNEEPIRVQNGATKSQGGPGQNSELLKIKATIKPKMVNNQLMKTKGSAETEVEENDHDESEEENNAEPAQSTPNETKLNDGNEMLKKDFGTIDLSKNSADKFVHIANMTELSGFNYSPSELSKFKIWSYGVVPFFIDEFSFDKVLRDKIREYLDSTNSLTGLRFMEIPKPPEDDQTRWVFFLNRRGQLDCTDYNHNSFTESGVQKVVLGYDCLVGGREMAAIVLAIAGVPPQHNSPDRDTYIEVSMKSVQPDKTSLFTPVSPHQWIFYDIQYDFLSAGHYPSHKYTVDGSATITARNAHDEPVGESEGYSFSDIRKIRMLYNYIVSENNKNLKRPDCQTLYRPGINLKQTKVVRTQKNARKKPQKYVDATKKVGETILDGKDDKENEKPEKPDLKPDPKLDPTPEPNMNDEYKKEKKYEDKKDGENDQEKKSDNTGEMAEEGDTYGSVDAENPRQKLKRKKKKRYDGVDPLKWDDIRTDESDQP